MYIKLTNMTKIYVDNYNPSKLKKKEYELQPYSVSENIKIELHSPDFGIHILENQHVYRIEPSLHEKIQHKKKFYKNYDCIFDFTPESKLPVFSQLPVDYVFTKYHIRKYKRTPKSLVTLMVEYNMVKPDIHLFMKQSYDTMVPTHFYFEYSPENEERVQEEIREWLDFL